MWTLFKKILITWSFKILGSNYYKIWLNFKTSTLVLTSGINKKGGLAACTKDWFMKCLFYDQVLISLGHFCLHIIFYRGQRLIGISGSLIWSKTLMELMFNPCGKFRWSPEGPVSQTHSPHLLVGAPGIFSDLLRSVQILKRKWGAESNGKLPHLLNP